jgi:hypothetical protein
MHALCSAKTTSGSYQDIKNGNIVREDWSNVFEPNGKRSPKSQDSSKMKTYRAVSAGFKVQTRGLS